MDTEAGSISSIKKSVNAAPDVDNQEVFVRLRDIFTAYKAKIEARFDLETDPISKDLCPYKSTVGPAEGMLKVSSGPEMDWLVDSYMGTPKTSFSNTHLTAWLGPDTNVPHLWMAMGTIPDLFVFFDLGPRVDMTMDVDYFKRYYRAFNQDYLKLLDDPKFGAFVSRCPLIRYYTSPTAISLKMPPTADRIDVVEELGHRIIDQWLKWVDEAPKVPFAERARLLERDLIMRRTIAEEDPANDMGEAIYGADLTKKLVSTLWGENRTLPRASGILQ